MTSATFDLPESVVADRTGMALDEVKSQRTELRCRKNGRSWFWSAEGITDLEKTLAAACAPQVAPAEPEKNGPQSWAVVRRRTPRVLHVVREGEPYNPALPTCVWLPRPVAHLFVPGMVIAALPRLGNPMVWDYAGHPDPAMRHRRFPRRAGKW